MCAEYAEISRNSVAGVDTKATAMSNILIFNFRLQGPALQLLVVAGFTPANQKTYRGLRILIIHWQVHHSTMLMDRALQKRNKK